MGGATRAAASVGLALALLAVAGGGAAAGDAPRGKRAGDVVLGLGAVAVLPPDGGGRVDPIGGRPRIGDAGGAALDLSVFLHPRVSVDTVVAPTRHDARVLDSALGEVRLGRLWIASPNLGVRLHLLPESRVSPYLGGGVAVALFRPDGGARSPGVRRVAVSTAFGPVLNAGLDVELAPDWLLNLDVRKAFVRADASVNSGLAEARVRLDPLILGVAVRYRF